MSCFICNADTISALAAIVTDTLNSRQSCIYFNIDGAAFADCIDQGIYDDHKVYRKLYIENLKAYNGRYNENVREFAKYVPFTGNRWTIEEQAKVYKAGQCFLYQISEDATYNRPIYKAVKEFLYTVAGRVTMQYADELGAHWT